MMTEQDLEIAERALFEEACEIHDAKERGEDRDLTALILLARRYWDIAQELLVQERESWDLT